MICVIMRVGGGCWATERKVNSPFMTRCTTGHGLLYNVYVNYLFAWCGPYLSYQN